MAAIGAQGAFFPLIGTDEATLDDKCRISIVTRKALHLGIDFVAAIGRHSCIVLYPASVWQELSSEVLKMPVLHPARQEFTRTVMGTAATGISFDQQNRIVIPADLREAVKLDRGDKVKVVGCGDRVEIWPIKAWENLQLSNAKKFPDREDAIEKTYASISDQVLTRRDDQQARAKESGA